MQGTILPHTQSRVDSKRLEHGCRRIHAGFPSFLVLGLRAVMFQLSAFYWVAVKEFKLSHHNSDAILFTIYPHHGNLD